MSSKNKVSLVGIALIADILCETTRAVNILVDCEREFPVSDWCKWYNSNWRECWMISNYLMITQRLCNLEVDLLCGLWMNVYESLFLIHSIVHQFLNDDPTMIFKNHSVFKQTRTASLERVNVYTHFFLSNPMLVKIHLTTKVYFQIVIILRCSRTYESSQLLMLSFYNEIPLFFVRDSRNETKKSLASICPIIPALKMTGGRKKSRE